MGEYPPSPHTIPYHPFSIRPISKFSPAIIGQQDKQTQQEAA